MAKLIKAVFVRDPDRNRTVLLQPGEEPEPRIAALVTNPDAWEDGQLPEAAPQDDTASSGDHDGPDKDDDADTETPAKAAPAAKKTAARKSAATSRSRGRNAADQGDSGE